MAWMQLDWLKSDILETVFGALWAASDTQNRTFASFESLARPLSRQIAIEVRKTKVPYKAVLIVHKY